MICCLMLLTSVVATAEPQVYTLTSYQNVWDVAVADMNGNGNKDVLLLTNDETAYPQQKVVALHLADADCAYSPTPDYQLALPEKVGAVILAEVDGAPPVEVVAVHTNGAFIYQFTDDGFVYYDEVAFSSLLPSYNREPVFIQKGAKDLLGNGKHEWLIPTANGLEIRTIEGALATASCDVASYMRRGDSVVITHRLPDYQTFEMEGVPTTGLAFLSDEFADFVYGEDWSQHERFRIPMTLDEKWDASAKMGDITGNDLPDLVITQTRGTVRMQSQTHVYLARGPFEYPEEPDAVFTVAHAVSSPEMMDVNNNGYLDLVFIRIPFGVRNVINFFMRNRLAVRTDVYLFDGESFSESSDYSTTMTMEAPEGRQRIAYTFGDFDGDGLVDVAYGRSGDALSIYTGDPDRFISSRPLAVLDMPSFGEARPYDLNNNGAKDIVLFRPGGDEAKRVDVIVF